MNENLIYLDPVLLGGIGLIVITLLVGVISIRSGYRSKYFRLKRKRIETGWKWIFASIGVGLVIGGLLIFDPGWISSPEQAISFLGVATSNVATPAPSVSPVPQTPTQQPSATAAPSLTASGTVAPSPSDTIEITMSPDGPVTSTMRPTFTSTPTSTLAPTFTPSHTMTIEPTWTLHVITATFTSTRAPTATEPTP